MVFDRIDELETALQDKERRNQALERANGELEAFAYTVAHDLRAPLRAITGFSRILQRNSLDRLDSEAKENLQLICDGAKRMGQIIDALLYLARCSTDKAACRLVDLTAVAKEVVGNLRSTQPGRQVDFVVDDCLPVQGDPRLLRILLENVIGNAWKYTSRCAVARIEFSYRPDLEAFCVRDNGVGFDMARADSLFRPFQRLHTDAEFEGSGIGLSIVKRVVERHDGQAWAESSPGAGTAIYFTLANYSERDALYRPK